MLWSVPADQGHCLGRFAWGTNQEAIVAHWVIVNRMDRSAVLTLSAWIRPRVSSLSHILLRRHFNSSPLALITQAPQGYAIRSLSMISDSFSSSPMIQCFSWVQASVRFSAYLSLSVDPAPSSSDLLEFLQLALSLWRCSYSTPPCKARFWCKCSSRKNKMPCSKMNWRAENLEK